MSRMLLYNRGLFEESESLYLEAYESMRDTLGEGSPSTLAAMSNLAMLYQSQVMSVELLHTSVYDDRTNCYYYFSLVC